MEEHKQVVLGMVKLASVASRKNLFERGIRCII